MTAAELRLGDCLGLHRLRVAGVFTAGDLVEGLGQVGAAMGHGAVAATGAHNWLREQGQATLQRKKAGR